MVRDLRFAAVFVARTTCTPLPHVLAMSVPDFRAWLDAAQEVHKAVTPSFDGA